MGLQLLRYSASEAGVAVCSIKFPSVNPDVFHIAGPTCEKPPVPAGHAGHAGPEHWESQVRSEDPPSFLPPYYVFHENCSSGLQKHPEAAAGSETAVCCY